MWASFWVITNASRAEAAPLHTKTLANGLRVAVEHRPEMRTAVVVMAYAAGSADEGPSAAGVASLTHRLMRHRDGKLGTAIERLDDVGAMMSGGDGRLVSTFTSVVEDPHLPLALWLEALRMAMFEPSAAAFEDARNALLTELARRRASDLEWQASTALTALALDQPLPGTSLSTMTLASARSFHRDHFGPGRAAITVISPVEPAKVLSWIDKTLGAVNRSTLPVQRAAPRPQTSRRATSLRSGGVHRAGVAYGWRIPDRTHPDHPVLTVAAEALGGGRTSALHIALTRKQNLAFRVRTTTGPSNLLAAFVESPRLTTPMDLAIATQHAARQLGQRPAEIASAKKRVARRLRRQLSTPLSRARSLSEHHLLRGAPGDALDAIAKVDAVTAEDVTRVAKTYLGVDHASMVECFPARIFLSAAEEAARRKEEARRAKEAQAAEKKKKRKRRRSKKKSKKKKAPTKKKSKKKATKKKATKKKATKKRKKKKATKKRKKKKATKKTATKKRKKKKR